MYQIVILAGGLATRLRPLTNKLPKSLIQVNNIPFVFHQIELLRRNGFTRIHFCLGHLGEMVEGVLRKSSNFDELDITFSFDGNTQLGTAGALKNASKSLEETFFVIYGDSYLDISYFDMYQFHKSINKNNHATLAIYKNDNKLDKSNVFFDGTSMSYNKFNPLPSMKYIDYGVSILRKNQIVDNVLDYPFDLANIYQLLSEKNLVIPYLVKNRFYEIGSFQGIEEISKHLNKKS